MEKVYVIGHLNPDTDTVVSAMSMAAFLNLREKTNRYVPVRTGSLNPETEYVFGQYQLDVPDLLEDASDRKLFLVDHNEGTQIVTGWSAENILGFVDHHKINFSCPGPVEIVTRPWGSTNTIIYDLFKKEGLELPDKLKPAMLAAILSDTVILKSVTTTPKDMQVVQDLAEELDIDYEKFGMDMFRAKAQLASKSAREIITTDFKNFDFSGKKVGIGQVETPDLSDVEAKYDVLKAQMQSMMDDQGYHSLILMMTDIIQEGSRLMVFSKDQEKIATIFDTSISEHVSEFLSGVMSRKRQVAKKLAEEL